jgi:16S rRNA (guanine(527)-N(7))-methyltransferase RsmG
VFKHLLASEFGPHKVLSEPQLAQLESHYLSLTRWNERLNLTRIRELPDSVKFHYCESLFLGLSIPMDTKTIVDVGSGGGFPGIPVAILQPECLVTLVESHQRKAVFLREVSRELPNVRVLSKRAEDVEGSFDWLISRAVAPAEVLRLRLAPRISLLISQEDAPVSEESARNLSRTERIPWGNHRVLFHVER